MQGDARGQWNDSQSGRFHSIFHRSFLARSLRCKRKAQRQAKQFLMNFHSSSEMLWLLLTQRAFHSAVFFLRSPEHLTFAPITPMHTSRTGETISLAALHLEFLSTNTIFKKKFTLFIARTSRRREISTSSEPISFKATSLKCCDAAHTIFPLRHHL